MKYIKLFENFNEELDIYDAKYIVISHLGEIMHDEDNHKCDNEKDILIFSVIGEPTEDQIQSCAEHLKEEGFFLFVTGKGWDASDDETSILVGVGNSFDEWINNWLNRNFGNLKRIECGNEAFYTEDHSLKEIDNVNIPKSVIFFTDIREDRTGTNQQYGWTKINWNKLWRFLDHSLFLSRDQIKEILKNWIEKTYGLKDIPPLDWSNI